MINKIINGYQIIKKIGSGSFGKVYEAIKNDKQFAIKFIDLDDIKKDELVYSAIKNEVNISQKTLNENFVKIYESFEYIIEGETFYLIIMEKCDGNLRDFIYSNEYKPSNEKTFSFIRQIISAINEIHKQNIIHRDLKLENILFINDTIKISDFGISKYAINNSNFISKVGYSSPQMIKELNYSNKTDIWSAGIICYEIANKKYPFVNLKEEKDIEIKFKERIKCNKYFEFNKDINENIKKLIKLMLQVEEKERPDTYTLINLIKEISTFEINVSLTLNEIIKRLNNENIEHLIFKDFDLEPLKFIIKIPKI